TLVEDLGATWERRTGLPVPLGGLLVRRALPTATVDAVCSTLRRSLAAARADPAACLPTMRRYAQELDDPVLWQHVELYVNEHTATFGALGRRCLAELARRTGRTAPPV